jgi:glycosyltransferase involved in cell wall biosynthesis
MAPCRVTVGLPFRNAARTLDWSIASVVQQTFSDWELILVDDGSTDSSALVASKYCNSRIRLIQDRRSMGLAARLNQISALANSPFVARLDADDIMHPSRLERQVRKLEDDGELTLVGSAAWIIDNDNLIYGDRQVAPLPSDPAAVLRNDFLIHPTVLGRTNWFLSNPYDVSYTRAQDKELWCRTRSQARFARLQERLLYFRAGTDIRLSTYRESCRMDRRIYSAYGPALVGRMSAAQLRAKSYLKEAVACLSVATSIERALVRRRSRFGIEEDVRGSTGRIG